MAVYFLSFNSFGLCFFVITILYRFFCFLSGFFRHSEYTYRRNNKYYNFYSLRITTMGNTYTFYRAEQFRNCQATIAYFENEIRDAVVFYSYTCPQLVKINGAWYQFTFDGSRKAGEVTTSKTTSKQKTNFFGSSWRDLPKINLADFEREYFDTRIDKYF